MVRDGIQLGSQEDAPSYLVGHSLLWLMLWDAAVSARCANGQAGLVGALSTPDTDGGAARLEQRWQRQQWWKMDRSEKDRGYQGRIADWDDDEQGNHRRNRTETCLLCSGSTRLS